MGLSATSHMVGFIASRRCGVPSADAAGCLLARPRRYEFFWNCLDFSSDDSALRLDMIGDMAVCDCLAACDLTRDVEQA